jgi:aerobic carbon-monoxide dehydrogenase large subunit
VSNAPATIERGAERGRYIGRSILRPGDQALLRGQATYVADFHPESALHAAIVRSPFPHAEIGSIDLSEARSAPGVKLVATGRDVHPGRPLLHTILGAADINSPDRPLLAIDKVTFAGEAVAAVVAESRYLAEDAAGMIDVDWVALEAVLDPMSATVDGTAVVHDSVPHNCYARRQAEFGDVQGALASADVIIEREIRHPRIIGAPMECRGVLAVPHGEGITVWLSAQNPHAVRDAILRVLGIDESELNVIVPEVGGGFGLKGHVYPEDILIPWLALKLDRPVRWIEDRLEHLSCSNHARDQRVRIRVGLTNQGRVTGLEAQVTSDVGAYGVHPMGPLLDLMTCSGLIPGPYDIRNYSYDSAAIVTNKAPGGAFRGVGMTTAVLVHERIMDIAALELGLDPAEIRRRNLVPAELMPYTTVTSHPYESGDFTAALEAALDAFDYSHARMQQEAARAQGAAIGIGIATYVEVTSAGSRTFIGRGMVDVDAVDRAHIRLDRTGMVRVQSTCPDIGQGSHATFAQVAAEALGVDLEGVIVEYTDTAKVGPGFGTGMSRSSAAGATGVDRAARELREAILEAAAWRLGLAAQDLTVDGTVVHELGDADLAISLAELGAATVEENGGVRLDAEAVYDAVQASHPYATHVCMVEVDRELGQVHVLRYVVAEDCGRVINPLIVDGQIQGGVAQGLATALLEEIRYSDDGQLLTSSFMDYLLPTPWDIPDLEIHHLETPSTNHDLGTKGAGEGGTIAAPAAIANAVADALGVDANRLPLTPERIIELIDQRTEAAVR